jgi:predicted metal-dependent hydrolase
VSFLEILSMAVNKSGKLRPETIEIGGVICRMIRSAKRRSVCIRITDDGNAEFLIPSNMPTANVIDFGENYERWIKENLAKRLELNAKRAAFELRIGDAVRCLGGNLVIAESDSNTIGYSDNSIFVPRGLSREEINPAVIKAYKLIAKDVITVRTDEISRLMGLKTPTVKINSAKSHWASCSKRGTLNFSWYSVMAPKETLDYIIIHELCHMIEFNHSPRFWALVAQFCPDYKKHKLILRNLMRDIRLKNWE